MDIKTSRRKARLRDYIATHGGNGAVARAAQVTTGYVSQLASDKYPGAEGAFARLSDRLMLPTGYFDGDTEIDPSAVLGRKVPVFSWETAGLDAAAVVEDEVTHHPGAQFALRMTNDSMASASSAEFGIAKGMTLFVDPTLTARDGDIVVARLPGAKAATCRQLVEDSGFTHLRAINPAYPLMQLPDAGCLLGVVVEVRMNLRATK